MIIIEAPGATLEVRAASDRLDRSIERTPDVTPAGVLVLVGDGGWNPARLTLSFRISSTVHADAAAERNSALAVLTKATAIIRGFTVTYVAGVQSISARLRGVWWEFTATFAPRALTSSNEGTGEALTFHSEVITLAGVPISMEVH